MVNNGPFTPGKQDLRNECAQPCLSTDTIALLGLAIKSRRLLEEIRFRFQPYEFDALPSEAKGKGQGSTREATEITGRGKDYRKGVYPVPLK
jgi:hypothetical protein